jgi:succinylglutamate desuccinylase
MDNMIAEYFDLPAGLLDVSVTELHQLIPEPALFHLSGRRNDTLFVSVLLHGNEPTGFLAMQRLLQKYHNQTLPRSLSIFFGNTQAARIGLRRLDGQPDFNRVWTGTEIADCPETRWAAEIIDIMRQRSLFASIDVHNNTGLNPHYACINNLQHQTLQLGRLFGRLLVYFTHPKGTQSIAFSELCPSVTLECGRPNQQHGTDHAFEFLDSCLHLTELPNHAVAKHDVDLYHTVAQVTIPENIAFSFSDENADLLLYSDLDQMNFTDIAAGTTFGKIKGNTLTVLAKNNEREDVTDTFFNNEDGQLVLTRSAMPSMLTLNERVIRQDCLCYLMERLSMD